MKKKDRVITGLDIGTSKICCAIGIFVEDEIKIVGISQVPCCGLRRGVIINIDAVSRAIKKSIEEAELMAGVHVSEVWISLSGEHIKSMDSHGMVQIRHQEVTNQDYKKALDAAKAVSLMGDKKLLHVLPQFFKIDDQGEIAYPLGMSGERLEAHVKIITCSRTPMQNLSKCLEKNGIEVTGVVLSQLASSISVLTEDDKKLGVALIDIGDGSCDIITYQQGRVNQIISIPLGGQHITQDIAVGLRTLPMRAEDVKKKYGSCLINSIENNESFEIITIDGQIKEVPKKYLAEIIEPRTEEILNFINNQLENQECLGAGIVFTGGGALLKGLPELAEYIFNLPVRLSFPIKYTGLTQVIRSPQFSTVLGLIEYGINQEIKSYEDKSKIGKAIFKVKELLGEVF